MADIAAGRGEVTHMENILRYIQDHYDFDFFSYKASTVSRSIQRRMCSRNCDRAHEYLQILANQPQEAERLISEITIEYSYFFRDRAAFDDLDRFVLRPLVKQRDSDGEAIRIWSAGCAGGEEAYTISMLLFEAARGCPEKYDPVIFATDVDENSLAKARAGEYGEESIADVSQGRLRKYFDHRSDRYYVKDFIKKPVCVGKHNFLEDPPISRLDLVSCRNVLIYFQKEAQAKALKLLHYAIKPGGYLFLGRAEPVSPVTEMGFDEVSRDSRIFMKKSE